MTEVRERAFCLFPHFTGRDQQAGIVFGLNEIMQLPGFFLQGGRLQAKGNAEGGIARDMQVAHPSLVTGGETLQLRG